MASHENGLNHLDLMQAPGRNKVCGFVGPFDAILRLL
jgi:hypothetical protein